MNADPDFDLELPQGWERHSVDDATLQAMLGQVKRRCMEEHRPQLYGELKAQLEKSFADMKRGGVFAYFSPSDPDTAMVGVPSSMNASIRSGEPGQTLDDIVRALIRERDATPLLGDKRTLRFETERSVRLGADTIISHSVVYMTPVPGSMRRRALVLVAGFGRPVDVPSDAELVQATRFLFDACVSTLTWRTPQPAEV